MKEPQKININTVDEFYLRVGIPPEVIRKVLDKKHTHFDVFTKRTAPDKLRIFYDADHVLRPIHKKIQSNILAKLDFPEEIKGGIIGNSPSINAKIHVGQKNIATLDIKNFFPSVNTTAVQSSLVRLGCSPEVADLITALTTADKHLPQGFSTSPYLAGIVLLEINNKIKDYLTLYGYKHSIWFDDITISGKRIIDEKIIKKIKLLFCDEGFVIHKEKKSLHSERQTVTGKVVNTKVSKVKKDKKFIEKAVYICEKIGIREYTRQFGIDRFGKQRNIRQQANHIGGLIGELISENKEKYLPLMKRWNLVRKRDGLSSPV
jgi:RNA-directed DNA polymerase